MKRIIIILLLILIVFSPSKVFAGSRADQAQKRYNYGVSHHKNGNLDLAIKEYQAAIKWDPSLWQAYHNLGLIYLNKKGYSGAQQMFEKVVALQPTNFEAHFNLGIIYFETGALNASVGEFNKAASLNPYSEDVHLNLASIYAKKNEETNVISELRKAFKINPYNLEVKKVLDEYDKEKLKTQQTTTQQTSLPKASAPKTSASQASSSQGTNDDYSGWFALFILVVIFISVMIALKDDIIRKVRNPVERAKKLIGKAETLKKTSKTKESLEKVQKLCEEAIKILSSRELFRAQRIGSIFTSTLPELKKLLTRAIHLYAKTAYLVKKLPLDKIQSEVEKAMSLCGDELSLLYLSGELLYLKNDLNKSSNYFNRVANLQDNGNLANLWCGILHYKLCNYKEAIIYIKSVDFPIRSDFIKEEYLLDELKDLSREHLRYKALIYYAAKDWNKCVEYFELLASSYAMDGDLRYYMAKAY